MTARTPRAPRQFKTIPTKGVLTLSCLLLQASLSTSTATTTSTTAKSSPSLTATTSIQTQPRRRSSFSVISKYERDTKTALLQTTTEPVRILSSSALPTTRTNDMQVQPVRPSASALTAPHPHAPQRPTTCPPHAATPVTEPLPSASINTPHHTTTASSIISNPNDLCSRERLTVDSTPCNIGGYQFCNRRRPIPNSYWATPWLVACVLHSTISLIFPVLISSLSLNSMPADVSIPGRQTAAPDRSWTPSSPQACERESSRTLSDLIQLSPPTRVQGLGSGGEVLVLNCY